MKKLLFGFFLPFSILLLSINAYPYAYALNENAGLTSDNHSSIIENVVDITSIQNGKTLIVDGSKSTLENQYRIQAAENEIEEEERGFNKKYVLLNSYLTAILFTVVLGLAALYLLKNVARDRRFTYLTSLRWYMVYRVFRI
jgi:hypothetical protein